MKIRILLTFLCISATMYAIDGLLVNLSGNTAYVVLKDAENNPLIHSTQIQNQGSMELEVLQAGNDYKFHVSSMTHYATVSGITAIETTLSVDEDDNFYIDGYLRVNKFEQQAAEALAPAG